MKISNAYFNYIAKRFATNGDSRSHGSLIAFIFKKLVVRLLNYRYVAHYIWFHKFVFRITNTKFDITYSVFRESFINDQYRIRQFLDSSRRLHSLLFLDIGRNHGLVFYYAMYHMMKKKIVIPKIRYIGVDPSPLKFVYFNYFRFLESNGIEIDYRIIDKAVVFDDSATVKLKYGEDNYGNFNVEGSNFEQRFSLIQSRWSYVQIEVDTISVAELKSYVQDLRNFDAAIVKIDCKNQTNVLFSEFLELLSTTEKQYLLTSERDESGQIDLSQFACPDSNTLAYSSIDGRS